MGPGKGHPPPLPASRPRTHGRPAAAFHNRLPPEEPARAPAAGGPGFRGRGAEFPFPARESRAAKPAPGRTLPAGPPGAAKRSDSGRLRPGTRAPGRPLRAAGPPSARPPSPPRGRPPSRRTPAPRAPLTRSSRPPGPESGSPGARCLRSRMPAPSSRPALPTRAGPARQPSNVALPRRGRGGAGRGQAPALAGPQRPGPAPRPGLATPARRRPKFPGFGTSGRGAEAATQRPSRLTSPTPLAQPVPRRLREPRLQPSPSAWSLTEGWGQSGPRSGSRTVRPPNPRPRSFGQRSSTR